ncbi:efflux RND transporter periplasmic adaptor subunit [Vibrio tubiashii]|uniref:efflux RND transporter periplasmic adaptor subunit n=1 Tax=Vibrio tubiashii TaxID=29498 RepID=UPI001EFE38A3|nr:efflux RND transporter periplasmic adaptor subunit [Vibrio tubiashii]MCG9582393.1 efflux RND transporter periplasmic adaptor subunit [Vibrio tubiashii]MCG9615984.1 efflux RND transporter periplasmic adaptor subunit [Vibrio tubiashii]MCG9687368.1 efflux RND transporter periplasmic adaptor subunit [Vibrio tubiashii]
MKNTKTLSLSIFCIGTTIIGSTAFAETMESVPVTVEIAKQQMTASTIEEVGKLKATDSAALTFSAGEKLKQLNFNDGDVVKKGELIAQLDDSQAKAELDKAESSLALAESKLARVLALLKKQPDSMSAQDVEELKQQASLAKADFSQKKTDLQNYQLVAPFDGQLTNFTHSVGSRVEAATALVSLIKLDPVEVHYSISQAEVGKAQLGQQVSVKVDAYGETEFTGTVDYIAPLVDENSGRVEVHAHLDNSDNKLVPGMFAKVSQSVGEASDDVVVSQTAVDTSGDQRFVWVIENNKATKRSVALGQNTNDGYVVIVSGLNAGERVVVTGRQNLHQDVQVAIQQTKSPVTLPARTLPAQPETKEQQVKPVAEKPSKEASKIAEPKSDKSTEVTNEAA